MPRPASHAKTWTAWRWSFMILGLACGVAAVWMALHWVSGSRWPLIFPVGFAVVFCATALRASDGAIQRFIESEGDSF